jgi:hypothetical protein
MSEERDDLIDQVGGDTADFGDGETTIRTYTGRYVHPLDPRPPEIDIKDIAHALSNQCRFGGHTRWFYSVAQHSCLVSVEVFRATKDRRLALWGLLHDASEAYLVDLPKPLKAHPMFGNGYRAAEWRLMKTICHEFFLDPVEPAIVKHFDRVLVCTEARDLMGREGPPWYDVEMLDDTILPWPATMARNEFIEAYRDLTR